MMTRMERATATLALPRRRPRAARCRPGPCWWPRIGGRPGVLSGTVWPTRPGERRWGTGSCPGRFRRRVRWRRPRRCPRLREGRGQPAARAPSWAILASTWLLCRQGCASARANRSRSWSCRTVPRSLFSTGPRLGSTWDPSEQVSQSTAVGVISMCALPRPPGTRWRRRPGSFWHVNTCRCPGCGGFAGVWLLVHCPGVDQPAKASAGVHAELVINVAEMHFDRFGTEE